LGQQNDSIQHSEGTTGSKHLLLEKDSFVTTK